MARPQLILPVSLYTVNGSVVDLNAVASAVNGIWNPAGIYFDVSMFAWNTTSWPTTTVDPLPTLQSLAADLTDQAKSTDPPYRHIIRGFYGSWTNSINGISFPNVDWDTPSFLYFVRDSRVAKPEGTQTPLLERVSSHELGHILRLAHYKKPVENLMAIGNDGVKITRHEISIARAAASWMLERSFR